MSRIGRKSPINRVKGTVLHFGRFRILGGPGPVQRINSNAILTAPPLTQGHYVALNLQKPRVNEILQAEECKYGSNFICTRKITT
jgi:hypothetical protein